MKMNGIEVKGHKGTWYVIAQLSEGEKQVFLLEHEVYGDLADHIAIDSKGNVILEDIEGGLDELEEFLESYYKCSICGEEASFHNNGMSLCKACNIN